MKKIAIAALMLVIIAGTAFAIDYDYHIGATNIKMNIEKVVEAGVRHGNQPFFIGNENSTSAVLLLHGFTASPWEVKELGEYLASLGLTVYAPLMAGHGTSPEDLANTKWKEWYASANKSYSLLRQISDCVFVVGVSTGGTLGLMLAEEHELCGIITMGGAVFMKDWKARFATIMKYFLPYTYNNLTDEEKMYYYEKRPTRSVAELVMLIQQMRSGIKDVTEPILVMHALNDKTIKPKSAEYIINRVSSEEKELVWLESGGHVIIRDVEKETAFSRIKEFIEKYRKG